jgi:flagellar hook assembly protein FlgD
VDTSGHWRALAVIDGVAKGLPGLLVSSQRVTIRWMLPVAGSVRVTVHDIAGREVRVLHEGWCAAGVAQVHWNGRGAQGARCASGLYFVRLDAGGTRNQTGSVTWRKLSLTH